MSSVLISVALAAIGLGTGPVTSHLPPPGVGALAELSPAWVHAFAGPNLTLSPGGGPVGTTVAAAGAGFFANSSVAFSFSGVGVNSTCSTDSSGAFPGASGTPCTFVVPPSPGGSEVVNASQGWNSTGIGVGVYPGGVAYDPVYGEAFVTNTGSNNVSVISDATNAIVATIAVGSYPLGIAYDAGLGEMFVANLQSNNVSVISDANNSVIATIAVGSSPYTVVYDSGQGEVFVENSGSNNVSVISDTNNSVVATVTTGSYSYAMTYDSAQGELFVASYGSDNVSIISDSTNTVVGTVPVGTWPFAIAYDSGVGVVFVSNIGSDNVSVISDTTNALVASVGVGNHPFGLAYDSGQGEVFAANYLSNNVSVIADSTNAVVATVAVGTQPYLGIAYDPGRGDVFVANYGSNNVSVISDASNSVIATVGVGGEPLAVAHDSGKGVMFVVNNYPSSVSVIAGAAEAQASFGVTSNLALLTPSGSADVGQSITVQGSGYSSSQPNLNFTIGSTALNCTSATTGTCVAGSLTSDSSGSVVAKFTVPPVTTSGSYLAKLSDVLGHTASATLIVYTDPTVEVPSASPASVDVGQSVTFSSTAASGTGTYSFAWSGLPPGCGGVLASIVCAPTSAGSYSVSVTATDSNGFSTASGTLTFVTYPDPTVSTPLGSVQSGGVDAGQSVTFATTASLGTLTYITYTWSGLPSGCAGSKSAVTCSGANLPAGTYAIFVTVTDTNNLTSASSGILPFTVIFDPSVSTPTASRPSVDLGQSVTFSATAFSGTGIYSYAWTGLPGGCSGVTDSILCRATAVGAFSIELQVTDSNNFTVTSAPLHFSVYADPITNLSADRVAFDAGQSVTLTATAGLGSGAYTYAWVGLPKGCSGRTAVVVCAPGGPGNYSVTVKVTDSNGITAPPATVQLTVATALSVEVSSSPSAPSIGQTVVFTANATGGTGAPTVAWAFGDGSTAAGAIVHHAFGSPGAFSVSVWVNDTVGGTVKRVLNLTIVSSETVLGVSATVFWPIVGVTIVAIAIFAIVLLRRRGRIAAYGQASDEASTGGAIDEDSSPGEDATEDTGSMAGTEFPRE